MTTPIDPTVKPRLERAIKQLLAAGRDTRNVADTLAAQASFGKYDGCTPTAIKELADAICHEINRQNRILYAQAQREIAADIAEIFKACPTIRRVIGGAL